MAHLEPESLNTDGETEQLMDWGSGDTGTPGTPVTVTASVGKRKGQKLRTYMTSCTINYQLCHKYTCSTVKLLAPSRDDLPYLSASDDGAD